MTTATAAPPVLTIRQTYLTWILSKCPKGARALIDGKPGPSYGGAARGTAVHEFFARYNEWLYAIGKPTDWTQAQTILRDILSEHPELTIEERDDVTEQARMICDTYLLDREHYYGSEEHLEYDLTLTDGRVVRITGTLDLLLLDSSEGIAVVRDAKSNHQLPPDSAIPKDLQLRTYALLVFRNMPEVVAVKGELWFPRYGVLLPRKDEALWTREDIDEFEGHLRDILAAFLDAPHHEAIPGTHCQYCPERRVNHCTLWRSYYGVTPPPVLSVEQFQKIGRQIIVLEQRLDVLKSHAKNYVNEHGGASVGSGEYAEVFDFHKSEGEDLPAAEVLAILEDNSDLIGQPDISAILSVKQTARLWKSLRYHKDLKGLFDDIAIPTHKTTFRHKKVSGDDD
ncbi:MAG: PD-(D/E)XK nuclease family protein [Armatimonadetes bacterium]|nr:PD-(D/E)XK nuclease family protein [Armatimonadota bacterium]